MCNTHGALENCILCPIHESSSSDVMSWVRFAMIVIVAVVLVALLLPFILSVTFCEIWILAWEKCISCTQSDRREGSSVSGRDLKDSSSGSNHASNNAVDDVTSGSSSSSSVSSRRNSDGVVGHLPGTTSSSRLVSSHDSDNAVGGRRNSDGVVGHLPGTTSSFRLVSSHDSDNAVGHLPGTTS